MGCPFWATGSSVQTPNSPSTEQRGKVPCYKTGGDKAPVMFLPWMTEGDGTLD